MFNLRSVRLTIILFILLSVPLACSKKDLKPSDDDLIRIKEIYAMVNMIKEAYTGKDLASIIGIVEPSPAEFLNILKRGLETDFDEFRKIRLGFYIDSIVMDKDMATVNLHWEGEWEPRSDKMVLKEKGNAIFKIKGEKKMKFSAIEGDNPFGIYLLKDHISKERRG